MRASSGRYVPPIFHFGLFWPHPSPSYARNDPLAELMLLPLTAFAYRPSKRQTLVLHECYIHNTTRFVINKLIREATRASLARFAVAWARMTNDVRQGLTISVDQASGAIRSGNAPFSAWVDESGGLFTHKRKGPAPKRACPRSSNAHLKLSRSIQGRGE